MKHIFIVLVIVFTIVPVSCKKKSKIPPQYEIDNRNFKQSIILLAESRDLSNPPGSEHQESYTLPESIEVQITEKLKEGIRLGKDIRDAYLNYMHPELKHMFKNKLIKGSQLYYEGLKFSDSNDSLAIVASVLKQVEACALVMEWIKWWDKNGRTITDKIFGD